MRIGFDVPRWPRAGQGIRREISASRYDGSDWREAAGYKPHGQIASEEFRILIPDEHTARLPRHHEGDVVLLTRTMSVALGAHG
jgi:hypothetical protein